MIYVVSGNTFIQMVKSGSKYFTPILGNSLFTDKIQSDDNNSDTNKRGSVAGQLNKSDRFAYNYLMEHKITLYKNGSIGDIIFYTDLQTSSQDKIAIYQNEMEVIYDIDFDYIRTNGITDFLGKIIKDFDGKYQMNTNKPDYDKNSQVVNKNKNLSKDEELEKFIQIVEKMKNTPGSIEPDEFLFYHRNKKNFKID